MQKEQLIALALKTFGTYDPPSPISLGDIADFATKVAADAVAVRDKEIADIFRSLFGYEKDEPIDLDTFLIEDVATLKAERDSLFSLIRDSSLIHLKHKGAAYAIYQDGDTFTAFGGGMDSKGHTHIEGAYAAMQQDGEGKDEN